MTEEGYQPAIPYLFELVNSPEPIDYAAILKAANRSPTEFPESLSPGKSVKSVRYGIGKIAQPLGNSLIVKFPGYSIPVQFKDWQKALASGELCPLEPTPTNPQQNQTSDLEKQIATIPIPAYRAIATELTSILNHVEAIASTPPQLHPLPQNLPSPLRQALSQVSIEQIYRHQLEALTVLRQGYDLALATPTASGKTLCYNIAILEACLNAPQTCALYIFPLKALAFDQLRKLQELTALLPPPHRIEVGQLTGDVPTAKRISLFVPDVPQILAVSPDLLHYQLAKIRYTTQWEGWREFLSRLRYVVIDESHTYIGAFGAHFANLMRRLRRAVDSVGGNSEQLQFIFSSATIGNPAEMALRFSGRVDRPERLHLIDSSSAGNSGQVLLSLKPSDTANPDAAKIVLSWLQHDLSGIVFCNSRAAVKSLQRLITQETAKQGQSYLAKKIAPFYGSLKGQRRRTLIQQLTTRQIQVLLSTSALEAGIDLPELDCCLIRGYPGSIMSFRQRIGRVGRRYPGLAIFLPVAQNSLDYYYGKYPQQLISGEVESAAFNPDYPTILSQHLRCCCTESGLPSGKVESYFGAKAGLISENLVEQHQIRLSGDSKLWGSGYPHREVNLRGSSLDSFELINTKTGQSIEEMPRDLAYREVFPGAVYLASDDSGALISYQCETLDLRERKAQLKPFEKDPNLSTEAETNLDIELIKLLEDPKIITTKFPEARLRLRLSWGKIKTLVTGYKLVTNESRLTCKNPICRNHRQALTGKVCPACHRRLQFAEIRQEKDSVTFKTPYSTEYEAPVVKVEVNPALVKVIINEVDRLKYQLKQQNGTVPDHLKGLWLGVPAAIALHSIGHQMIFAVPLAFLSSHHDVNFVTVKEGTRVVGYFFDTCPGGNGATETIFAHFSQLTAKAHSLATACDCEYGCPRCLMQHGCPEQNEALNKIVGLFLLEAVSKAIS